MDADEKREYMRRWWLAHPDYKKQYRAANRDRLNAQGREHARTRRERHPERVRELRRESYHRNLESAREGQRSAKHLEAARRWKLEHREQNRLIKAVGTSRRRTRKQGNGGSHTPQEWIEKCALLGNVCIYCGEAKPLTRDHKIPISRGGTDDIANIVPSCRPCNTRKNNRTTQEYLAVLAARRAA